MATAASSASGATPSKAGYSGRETARVCSVERFNPNDWGNYKNYIFQESILHVKTGGHYWKETFGNSSLNPDYEPEKRVQFGLPYVRIPKGDAIVAQHGNAFPDDFQDDTHILLPFHPSYLDSDNVDRFTKYVQSKGYELVAPEESTFLATPTSSYRTLVVKNRDNDSFFQVKVGSPGRVMGANRDLWHEEVDQSVSVSKKVASISGLKDSELEFMSEDAGVIHKLDDGENRANIVPLNCLFRSLPGSAAEYYNFSALLSTVQERKSELGEEDPIVYRLANNYIAKNKILNKREGLKAFIRETIDRFTNAATLYLKHGILFEPHSQNIGVKVKDGLVTGFFVRDGGGFSLAEPDTAFEDRLPRRQQKEILSERQKKSAQFDGNVVNSMSIFLSFYVVEKMSKVFLRDSVPEDVYGRYGLDHPPLQGRYRVMNSENVLLQSGPNTFNRVHQGASPLDTRPLERRQVSPDNRDMYLTGADIDELRQFIKHSYIRNIENNIGELPEAARRVLIEFRAMEHGPIQGSRSQARPPTFSFGDWLRQVRDPSVSKNDKA